KAFSAMRALAMTRVGYLLRLVAIWKLPLVQEWVDDFLEESDGKLILFGVHRAFLGPLVERYKGISVLVDGSVKGKDRHLAQDSFQTNPKVRLFLGNIKAAGAGMNLPAAHDTAFGEFYWTPGDYQQAEDRGYGRVGNPHGMAVWNLVARNTVEEKVLGVV